MDAAVLLVDLPSLLLVYFLVVCVILTFILIFFYFLLSSLRLTSLSVLLCSLGKLFFTCDECRFLIGHDVGAE